MATPIKNKDTVKNTNRQPMPKYKVILHNDDVNSCEYVLHTLCSVVGVAENVAYSIMFKAHNEGKALVIICVQEHAEFYKERLESKGLTASIEKE